MEEARRRAEDLLAVREKLMLAITHDFKAPLGSIMGYADLLSRLTVDERQRFYLDNMKTSSEHLLKLVVDLLDFHRLDLNKAEVNRVTFHPSRLLEEIHVSFEPLTAAKGLALHCDIAPELDGTYICDLASASDYQQFAVQCREVYGPRRYYHDCPLRGPSTGSCHC